MMSFHEDWRNPSSHSALVDATRIGPYGGFGNAPERIIPVAKASSLLPPGRAASQGWGSEFVPSWPRGGAEHYERLPTLGAWGVDPAAKFFGTDRKTFLLVLLVGLGAGWLANNAWRGTSKGLGRIRRGTKKLATPKNLAILAGTGIVLGAAYWYFNRNAGASAPARPAPAPVAGRSKLPVLRDGHWQRPQ
jgi:hypothetical protein